MPKGSRGGKRRRESVALSANNPTITVYEYELPRTVKNVSRAYYGDKAKNIGLPSIVLSDERIKHIERHHPKDKRRILKNLNKTIQNPDKVYTNPKKSYSVIFTRKLNNTINQLAIVYLNKYGEQKIWTSFLKSNKQLDNYVKNAKILYVKDN